MKGAKHKAGRYDTSVMRIDQLIIKNFKAFEQQTIDLHKQFTILVGDNGTGKTSLLDALAVAAGFICHKLSPGTGFRNIQAEEIRIDPVVSGDRVQFQACLPAQISATGVIGTREGLHWTRLIRQGRTRTSNLEVKEALQAIKELDEAALAQTAPLPVLAYYGAGRAWLPTNKRTSKPVLHKKPQRFDAYYKCLDTRIRDDYLNDWFLLEAAAANGHGKGRPGFLAAKQAILGCIPGADGLRFDSDRREIVLSINGAEQPYYNLSAGQRMMLALVADIAIKAVTLNSYLLGPDQPGHDDPSRVLTQSPGMILIDELDVHLHPKWQRQVASDLKRTFPAMQFVCTTHSPQIIGEVAADEIRQIIDGKIYHPPRSFGIDSSRVLRELMNAPARNESVEKLLKAIAVSIDEDKFVQVDEQLLKLEQQIGADDPEVTRARTMLRFLKDKE